MPKSFGLIEATGERLALTTEGATYLKDVSPRLLLEAAKRNVLGMRELIDYLRGRPHASGEILERMRTDLGVTWETDLQVGFRLGWLENIGVITPRGDAWALVEGSTPAPPDPPPTAKPEYTLEDYFAGKPAAVVDLFTKLDGRVLQLDESVQRVHRKQYIAYQVGKRTICSVIPQRKRLRLVLPLDPRDAQHTLVRDVSGIGHWGIGSFEVSYDSAEQLDQIMRWIAQALTEARTS